MEQANLIGIGRHKIGTDGEGITTLVAFHNCTLACKYCLNPQSLQPDGIWRTYTTQQLYEETRKDELYFLTTSGGVTFGGGEPCLQSKFISEFRNLCGSKWKLNIESALNVPIGRIEYLLPDIDHWIVDIKDMNCKRYMAYTRRSNDLVLINLQLILSAQRRVTVRVPLIPGYNNETDVSENISILKELGVTEFERLTYITKIKDIPR